MNTIMIPLDESRFSEHAIPLALSIAQPGKTTLHLVSAYPLIETFGLEASPYVENIDTGLPESIREGYQSRLDHLAARLSDQGHKVETSLLQQTVSASDILAEHAEALAPDLVIMTTHGRGGLARMFLGSVTDELIRKLAMPLIVVRPTTEQPDWENLPPVKRILVPLDGEPEAEKILPSVGQLATSLGAELTLLRVITPVLTMEYQPYGFGALESKTAQMLQQSREVQDYLHQEAEDYLQKVAADLRGRGFTVQAQVEISDKPAALILKVAEKEGYDLIALETHGRKGLSRMFLGSVADKVIRGATIPVMVHRPLES